MKAHLLLQNTFHNAKTREPISGVEHFKDAQFFDFGYIDNQTILDESEAAADALFEGFFRLPAHHCVFQIRHKKDLNPDSPEAIGAYQYRYGLNDHGTIFATGHWLTEKSSGKFYTNELTLGLKIFSPAAQTNWRLTRKYSYFEEANPNNLKWDVNVDEVARLIQPMLCALGRLNAEGIEREYIKPSEKLNKARDKKGKTPLVSYTKVKVAPYRVPLGRSGPREDVSTKRYHFRRGHVRRFANGQKTWVRQCHVGQKEDGEVKHHYEVSI